MVAAKWTRSRKAGLAGVLMLALVLPSCASTSVGQTLSSDEVELRQKNEAMTVTVVEGTLIGAAAGALLGGLVGGNTRLAAIGAGIGAIVGGAGGYWVSKQQESYANEEARVDAMIADVRAENLKLADYAVTARRVIAADRAKIQVLEGKIADQTKSRSELSSELAAIQENSRLIADAIENMKTKKQEFVDAANEARQLNAANIDAMDFEIERLEMQIAQLENDLNELNGALEVFAVG